MPLQEYINRADSNMEEFRNTFNIPGVSGFRGSKTRTKDRRTMVIYKWYVEMLMSRYLKEALQHRTRWEKLTSIFELHGNISKFSGHISFFRHDFTRQKPMSHIWLNSNRAVALQDIFLREHTFKMCRGLPKWPNTCKWWHFQVSLPLLLQKQKQ